jgi:protein-disulfide isomerase
MKTRFLAPAATLLALTAMAQTPAKSGRAMGNAVAAITIEVFSDFQCPNCKVLYENTLVPLIHDYVQTGRVYLLERSFPLNQHAYARPAANYACAAERIGKYEQVCDVLFREQNSWAASGKVDETVSSVLTPAEAAKVRALAKDPAIAAEVEKDIELGTKAKVGGTPMMLISHNGQTYPITGAVSYPILRKFLDDLAKR